MIIQRATATPTAMRAGIIRTKFDLVPMSVSAGAGGRILSGIVTGSVGLILASVLLAGAITTPPVVEENDTRPAPADIPPVRTIADPYPEYNGIAVDPENGFVGVTDPNRKSLLLYDGKRGNNGTAATVPLRQVIGPETYLGMISGIFLDAAHREIYAVNNDIEDTIVVMSYDSAGDAEPARVISVPHQSWGLAFSRARGQMAVSVEMSSAIVFYAREAKGVEAPVRVIRGPHTGLSDPHGISWDEDHSEIAVANHGNFRGLVKNTGGGCAPMSGEDAAAEGGQFQPPSIRVFSADAAGDASPLRTIQGARTKLDWPMGLGYDPAHDAFLVANNGDDSVLVFDRKTAGDAPPVRIIRGDRTGINRPIGLAVNQKNGEIWVANWGDHTALAFDAGASGNVAPKRIIRSAPAGTPTPGFGNPEGLAYDSKREQLLVPN
jgi:DNA-binding beta-propeller fold protein YncE